MYLTHKFTLKRLISVCLVVIATLLATTVSHANQSGTVSSVSGYVTVTTPDGEVRRLKAGDKVNDGDVINTGDNSSAVIELDNGEKITLGAVQSYALGQPVAAGKGENFANRSLGGKSPTLSTSANAGGGTSEGAPTTPAPGGSPTN